jgi:hypothetical protein
MLACMEAPKYQSVAATAALLAAMALGDGARATTIQVKSELKGASLIAVRTLPRSPENGSLDDYCSGYRAIKLSAIGKQVAKRGWIVTSESSLGRYRVVTFASDFTPGTSAMCFAGNPQIAVFDGSSLVAIASTSASSDLDVQLGVVEPLESGALLIWGGGWTGSPVGELHVEPNGVRLTATSAQRTFCHFRAVVPNIYGRSIDVARKTLIARGWQPLRPEEAPGEHDGASRLAKRGIVEAQDCAGTGVGYCGFSYRGPAGVLHVITIGDDSPGDNSVVNYSVECNRPTKP